MVRQFGKPILRPSEAEGLSPKERKKVEVVTEKTTSEVLRRITGGGGRGKISVDLKESEKRQEEIARKAAEKKVAEAKAQAEKKRQEEIARKAAEKKVAEAKAQAEKKQQEEYRRMQELQEKQLRESQRRREEIIRQRGTSVIDVPREDDFKKFEPPPVRDKSILEKIRDVSKRQEELMGAEAVLGVGGVSRVKEKKIIPISEKVEIVKKKIQPPEDSFAGKTLELLKSPTPIPAPTTYPIKPFFKRDKSFPLTDVTQRLKKDKDIPYLIKGGAYVAEELGGTPLKLITTGIIGAGLGMAPAVVRTGVAIAQTGIGTSLFFKGETEAERAGGLIIGTLGATGTVFELFPYLKGGIARFSPKYKGVKKGVVEIAGKKVDVKFIEKLGFDEGTGQLGFIPESVGKSRGDFPAGAGALERGGFGFKPSEQLKAFGGKELRLATSQRGLIIEDGVVKVDPSISELGFFFTPADPITGIPQTRISRLGLLELFKRPKGDVRFSLKPSGKPQIIITEPTQIITRGLTGEGGVARISPKGTTELEATALSNILLKEKLGVTVIKGQKVDIFLGKLTGKAIKGKGVKVGDVVVSVKPSQTIPLTSIIGGIGISSKIPSTKRPPTTPKPSPTPFITIDTTPELPSRKIPSPIISSPIISPPVSPKPRMPLRKITPMITTTTRRDEERRDERRMPPRVPMLPKREIPKRTPDFQKGKENLDIFVKKKGVFVDVGDASSKEEAFKKLKKELLKNLSASGFVSSKKTGEKLSAKSFVSQMFRLSKQAKLKETVLVQKKSGGSGRLTTSGERLAIQGFLKKSPKNNPNSKNNFNLFGSSKRFNKKTSSKKKKFNWFS